MPKSNFVYPLDHPEELTFEDIFTTDERIALMPLSRLEELITTVLRFGQSLVIKLLDEIKQYNFQLGVPSFIEKDLFFTLRDKAAAWPRVGQIDIFVLNVFDEEKGSHFSRLESLWANHNQLGVKDQRTKWMATRIAYYDAPNNRTYRFIYSASTQNLRATFNELNQPKKEIAEMTTNNTQEPVIDDLQKAVNALVVGGHFTPPEVTILFRADLDIFVTHALPEKAMDEESVFYNEGSGGSLTIRQMLEKLGIINGFERAPGTFLTLLQKRIPAPAQPAEIVSPEDTGAQYRHSLSYIFDNFPDLAVSVFEKVQITHRYVKHGRLKALVVKYGDWEIKFTGKMVKLFSRGVICEIRIYKEEDTTSNLVSIMTYVVNKVSPE